MFSTFRWLYLNPVNANVKAKVEAAGLSLSLPLHPPAVDVRKPLNLILALFD